MPRPSPVRPELVEGPFFLSTPRSKKKLSFDKLRTNGALGWFGA
jgi:hypothetical protein